MPPKAEPVALVKRQEPTHPPSGEGSGGFHPDMRQVLPPKPEESPVPVRASLVHVASRKPEHSDVDPRSRNAGCGHTRGQEDDGEDDSWYWEQHHRTTHDPYRLSESGPGPAPRSHLAPDLEHGGRSGKGDRPHRTHEERSGGGGGRDADAEWWNARRNPRDRWQAKEEVSSGNVGRHPPARKWEEELPESRPAADLKPKKGKGDRHHDDYDNAEGPQKGQHSRKGKGPDRPSAPPPPPEHPRGAGGHGTWWKQYTARREYHQWDPREWDNANPSGRRTGPAEDYGWYEQGHDYDYGDHGGGNWHASDPWPQAGPKGKGEEASETHDPSAFGYSDERTPASKAGAKGSHPGEWRRDRRGDADAGKGAGKGSKDAPKGAPRRGRAKGAPKDGSKK